MKWANIYVVGIKGCVRIVLEKLETSFCFQGNKIVFHGYLETEDRRREAREVALAFVSLGD